METIRKAERQKCPSFLYIENLTLSVGSGEA